MEEMELTRRGFVVLAVSATWAFFVKPAQALAEAGAGANYLVSGYALCYGYICPKEDYGTEFAPEPYEDEEVQERISVGDVLTFAHDPEVPEDDPALVMVAEGEHAVCEIPEFGSETAPESFKADELIYDRMTRGERVWAIVTKADHHDVDANEDVARVHELEFDVFYA